MNYTFRMHDPRIGRFFAIDPLFRDYPWNSPYAFSENKVIASVELEGLESVDLNCGIDNTLSGANLKKVQSEKNTKPWDDLDKFSVPSSYFVQANERQKHTYGVAPQLFKFAQGDKMSYDYYSINIKLPSNMTMKDLFNYVRLNFGNFKKGADATEKFEAISKTEADLWKKNNPLTTLFRFTVDPPLKADLDLIRERMVVMTTNFSIDGNNSMSWVFTPVNCYSNLFDGDHPLAGHRQFGIINNNNGTYTFFTRGIDTAYGTIDAANSEDIFRGAHELWTNVMKNVAKYVNDKGGKATINPHVAFRKNRKK